MNGTSKGTRLAALGHAVRAALSRRARLYFWVIPALFYTSTACRTPGWMDATMIASNTVNMVLGSWVNTHNLFHLIGHLWLALFPAAGNTHFHLVLLCALLGTLTIYFLFLIGLELTDSAVSAGIGALVVMMSHSLWWHSTMLEVYTLNTALMAVFLYLVVRFDKTRRRHFLYLAVFFFGLGCSNHLLVGLFIFAFAALVIFLTIRERRFPLRMVLVSVPCFLLGFALYLVVFTQDLAVNIRGVQTATTSRSESLATGWEGLKQTVDKATGSYFRRYMFTPDLPRERLRFWRINYFVLQLWNYPSLALPLAYLGLYLFWRRSRFRLTFVFFAAGILAQAVWSANYFIWDMYAFALPVFVLLGIPLILSIHWLWSRRGVRRLALLAMLPTFLLPLWVFPRIAVWYHNGGIVQAYFDSYPEVAWTRHTFDPVAYVANPNKRRYDKVQRYVDELFRVLPQGARLLNSDPRSDYPLRYYYREIKNERTDLVYYSLFVPSLTAEVLETTARRLEYDLEQGAPVYSASVEFPERAVLDRLCLLLDPSRDPTALSAMSTAEYLASFPRVRFRRVDLVPEEDVCVYAMEMKAE